MASLIKQQVSAIFNHFIKQNTHRGRVGQDGATSGTIIINEKTVDYLVVYDGHGNGKNRDVTVNYLRGLDWPSLLVSGNFYLTLSENLKKLDTSGGGSTLSVCLIYDSHFETFWIGDSTIRIYDEKEEIWRSKDHNEKNPDEVTRMSEMGIEILKKYKRGSNNGQTIYTLKTLSGDTLNMTQGALFDYGSIDTINMSHALGHNNCTGDFISHASVPREEGKKYKVIAGTDGLWELIHDEAHNEFLIDRKNQSEAVVKFADTLWTKDWNYNGSKTSFPQWNIDDVAVAIWSD